MQSAFVPWPEVAERLGVSEKRVQALCALGRIPHCWIGNRRYFPRAAFEAWLADRNVEALASVKPREVSRAS